MSAGSQDGAGPSETAVVAAPEKLEREQLTEMVRSAGLEVAAAVKSIAELPDDATPAVLVVTLDVTVPAAPAELRRLRSALGSSRIVVVSPAITPTGVRRLLDGGAEGLVLKPKAETSLGPTLRAVLSDQVCVPRTAGRQLQKPALTSREKQVLGMVTLGFGNGEIAGKLFLAESTVKSHLSSAFNKLGVRSRSEAAALILDPDGALGPGILSISAESARAGGPAQNGR